MATLHPRAGVHYPRSMGELRAWFATDADCLDYLEWLRWPDGFVCPRCGHAGGWRSGTAGSGARVWRPDVGDGGDDLRPPRTPLTVWFMACWLFATQKDGVSALSLQRALEIGSYQTAWAMLHRLRSVLVRPGRERLTGTVEVDETFIGGEEPGLRGGRARGKKSLVGVAVEVKEPRGLGRCRMAIARRRLRRLAAPVRHRPRRAGRHRDHRRLAGLPRHRRARLRPRPAQPTRRPARGDDPFELLPGVHRVASLAKRWLLGTHQGSVDDGAPAELPRRVRVPLQPPPSRSRGLVFHRVLELAVGHEPVRYRDLVVDPQPKKEAAHHRGDGAPTEPGPPASQPWRAA